MKIYYYDSETGIYQGEGFDSAPVTRPGEGVTTVAPAPFGTGEVPVFDPQAERWSIVPIAVVRKAAIPIRPEH